MNRSVRYLWILMIAQACALGLVFGWRVCRRPSPYVPVKKTFADLHGGLIVTLDMFKADCGRYPTTSEAWKVLMNPPADGSLKGWRGPYLEPPGFPKIRGVTPMFIVFPAPTTIQTVLTCFRTVRMESAKLPAVTRMTSIIGISGHLMLVCCTISIVSIDSLPSRDCF
jgi:hypothetical protein